MKVTDTTIQVTEFHLRFNQNIKIASVLQHTTTKRRGPHRVVTLLFMRLLFLAVQLTGGVLTSAARTEEAVVAVERTEKALRDGKQ